VGTTNLLLVCLPSEQRPPLSVHSQSAWSEPFLPKVKNSTTPSLPQLQTPAARALANEFLPVSPLAQVPRRQPLGPLVRLPRAGECQQPLPSGPLLGEPRLKAGFNV